MAEIILRLEDGYHVRFNNSHYVVLIDKNKHLIFRSNDSGEINRILPVSECKDLSIVEVLNNFSNLLLGGRYVNKQEWIN